MKVLVIGVKSLLFKQRELALGTSNSKSSTDLLGQKTPSLDRAGLELSSSEVGTLLDEHMTNSDPYSRHLALFLKCRLRKTDSSIDQRKVIFDRARPCKSSYRDIKPKLLLFSHPVSKMKASF